MSPLHTAEAMSKFDQRIRDICIEKILQRDPKQPLTEEASYKIHAPTVHGGLGLRTMEIVVDAAYLTCWIENLHALPPEYADLDNSSLERHLQKAFNGIKAQLPEFSNDEAELPDTLEEYTQDRREGDAPHKLQRHLVKEVERAMKMAHNAVAQANQDTVQKARTLSATGSNAGTWLNTIPNSRRTFLTNVETTLAIRLRLGLPPSDHMPEFCACGFDMERDHDHFLNCPKFRGSWTTRQHNRLVRVNAHHLNLAGFTVTVEPYAPRSSEKKHRPDAIAFFGPHSHMSDTTRVNATAPSRVESGQKQGRVAKYAEAKKKSDYLKTELAKTHEFKDEFIPIAYEVHGTWGEGAISAVTPILKGAQELMGPTLAKDLAANYVRRIAVELQRGNAYLQRMGLDKARASSYNTMYTYNVQPLQP